MLQAVLRTLLLGSALFAACVDEPSTDPGSPGGKGDAAGEEDTWSCDDGELIPADERCDGLFSCTDRSDETGCECPPGDWMPGCSL